MKGNKIKVLTGIYAISMLSMATLIVAPVLGLIARAFPNADISKIQLVLAMSQLTGLIAAFIVGKLATAMPKRTIALTGAALTCIFGLIPYFLKNLNIMIVCAGLTGITVGFITNVIPGLIADYFPIEERQGIMGRYAAFVSLGTMIMMYVSGQLGTISWNSSYLTYLFAGVVFVIALVCLPRIDALDDIKGDAARETINTSLTGALNPQIITIAICGFFYMAIYNAYNNNIALLVQESGAGESSMAGLITTVGSLGGLLSGVMMGRISRITKTNTLACAYLITGAALAALAFSNNIAMMFFGSFLTGFAQSMFFAQAPFLITISVRPILITMGMGVLSVANGIGGFLSPYIVNAVNHAILDSSAKGAMIISAIIGLMVGAVLVASRFQGRCMENLQKSGGKI